MRVLNDAGGGEERCPILVGCEERHFRHLDTHLINDVLFFLRQLGQPFCGLLDSSFPLVTNVG